jgi:hypothetical protein
MSVAVFIEHRVRPGQRDDVRTVWERWLRPAIEANDAHEAYRSYVTEVESLLVGPPKVTRADDIWTKPRR